MSLLSEDDARMNARESPNTGTAKDAQQHRLRLIVERVRRGNFRNSTLARQLAEKTVAQLTRRRLDTGTDAGTLAGTFAGTLAGTPLPVNPRLTSMQFEPVLLRQLRDEPLVFLRLFSAQLVIYMRNR